MKTQTKITAIIPSFNQAHFIAQTINSVVVQQGGATIIYCAFVGLVAINAVQHWCRFGSRFYGLVSLLGGIMLFAQYVHAFFENPATPLWKWKPAILLGVADYHTKVVRSETDLRKPISERQEFPRLMAKPSFELAQREIEVPRLAMMVLLGTEGFMHKTMQNPELQRV